MADNNICVVGSASAIEQDKELFEKIVELVNNLDAPYENKTEHGSALEELSNLLLNYCKGIKSTPKLKTKSNQLDCAIRNDFKIKLTVYEEFGSFLYGECKNEKSIF